MDECFAYNYEQARNTDLRVGAYHFLSYDSGGDTQAANFLPTCRWRKICFHRSLTCSLRRQGRKPTGSGIGDKRTDDLYSEDRGALRNEAVIYATEKSYALYLAGDHEEYDIWIRGVYTTPILSDGRSWIFWRYTNRAHLAGYSCEEVFIDMNVFCRTAEEFAEYPGKNA